MEKDIGLNISNIKKELLLILEILKEKQHEKILNEAVKNIDWNVFLELTFHHRLFPVLFNSFKKIDNNLIPSYVLETISEAYKMNTFQMLLLSSETVDVCKFFEENNIKSLVLKGPNLGFDLYGDISLRTSGDLDLLVSLKDLEKADKLLKELGYEKNEYIHSVLNDWKWRHHHFTYHHSQKGIKVEVHWRLNPGPGKEPTFDELWERKRKSTFVNYPIFSLCKEDLFLFLVSHGARHGWSRIRWVMDISQITKQEMDWTLICSLLKKYHVDHLGGQAILLCSTLLSVPIKKEMSSLIKGEKTKNLAQEAIFYLERMVNLHDEPLQDEVAVYHKNHLFSLMSNHHKCLFFLSCLHPYSTDAVTLPLPSSLHVLYFPLRPFLWLWRRTRRHAENGRIGA